MSKTQCFECGNTNLKWYAIEMFYECLNCGNRFTEADICLHKAKEVGRNEMFNKMSCFCKYVYCDCVNNKNMCGHTEDGKFTDCNIKTCPLRSKT